MSSGDLYRRLLALLVDLPGADTVTGRRALVMNTGAQHLARYITWEGSPEDFFVGLIPVLTAHGQSDLLSFLDGIETSNLLGIDRLAQLRRLRSAVRNYGLPTYVAPSKTQVAKYLTNLRGFVHTCLERERIKGMPIELAGALLRSDRTSVFDYIAYLSASPGKTRDDKAKRFRTMSLSEALSDYDRIVVLGEPGSGKTTLLYYQTLHAIDQYLSGKSELVPIFARLRYYSSYYPSIVDFLKESLSTLAGKDSELLLRFDLYLVGGQFLILLDGLNELPERLAPSGRAPDVITDWWSFGTYDERERALERLGAESLSKMLVSCRIHDFYLNPAWHEFFLLPMNEEQRRRFAISYLGETMGAELVDQLNSPSRLQHGELTRNPFYLKSLVAYFHEHNSIPQDRSALAAHFILSLLARERIYLDEDDLRNQPFIADVSRLAYELIDEGYIGSAVEQERILRTISEAALELALDCTFLIEERIGSRYLIGFNHQILQEYFAACEMVRRFVNGDKGLRSKFKSTDWEQVTVFAVGLSDRPHEFIDRIIPGIFQDYKPRRAHVALKCARDLELPVVLRERIITHARRAQRRYRTVAQFKFFLLDILGLVCRISLARWSFSKMAVFVINHGPAMFHQGALKALGWIGGDEAWEVLRRYADHRNDHVVFSALVGLSQLKDDRAVPILAEKFETGHISLRWLAGTALALLKPKDRGTIELMTSKLSSECLEDSWLAAYVLGEIGDIGEDALSALRREAALNRYAGYTGWNPIVSTNAAANALERIEGSTPPGKRGSLSSTRATLRPGVDL
jgi:hypothetical protein